MSIKATISPESLKAMEAKFAGMVTKERMASLFDSVGQEIKDAAEAKARSYGGRNFWRDKIIRKIKYDANSDGVTVGVASDLASHVQFGGTISAPGKGPGSKFRKYLTIPISDAAYGKSVGDFPKENILFLKGIVWLVELRGKGKKEESVMEPLFVLKKSVKQKARPFMPWGESEIHPIVKSAVDSWMEAAQ
jgi:hypothetical protein